ncbi:MAG TPA: phospholipid carrier-dependent glycosyltransferase [Streptosporangiaceae bacterium]|jgi:dolichyl-phosphate-mannose--protein O-mannosyl transferase
MAMTEIDVVEQQGDQRRPPPLREWLAPPIPGSPLLGWIGPIVVAVFAAFLRFDRLAIPHAVVFDETYYAKDSLALLKFGWEHNTVKNADAILLAPGTNTHNPPIWADGASFVAHPPAGKWLIAIGEWMFGATPFGWRFMAAVCGSLSVLILARIARRMTGSTLLGCAAGLLLALDGLHLVTSRTALLDIFVMFWILCAFGCLLVDRDRTRARLADKIAAGGDAGFGPFLLHGWRIGAAVCLGLACATKWTGIYYVAAFGVLALVWDMGARRAARVQYPYAGALVRELPLLVAGGVVVFVTYIASWWGWIFKPGGWGRGTVAHNVLGRPFEAMPNLWQYHKEMWNFHTNLHSKHPYQSWPWDWPILRRPVAFYYQEPKNACGDSAKCSKEILGIGTPAIWWTAVVALVLLVFVWLYYRDWRAGAILLGYAAGWLPWFWPALGHRTMFLFYATPMLPFMVLAIVLCMGMLIGPATDPGPRRLFGSAIAGAYMLLVLANFIYFYPVLAAKVIPYEQWHHIVRFKDWI